MLLLKVKLVPSLIKTRIHSRRLFTLSFVFIAVLLILFPIPSFSDSKQRLTNLRRHIEVLKQELATAESSYSEATDALKEVDQSISNTNRTLREVLKGQETLQIQLKELISQSARIESNIRLQRSAVADLLHDYYLMGRADPFIQLLKGDDPNQAARRLYYYRVISRYKTDLIKDLRSNLFSKKILAEQIKERKAKLVTAEIEVREKRQLLFNQQRQRRDLVNKISQQIQRQRKEIGISQRNEERLARLVKGLNKIINSKTIRIFNEKVPDASSNELFANLRGKLRLPTVGELLNRFGTLRNNNGGLWRGLFIRAKSGQDVKAVAPGIIVFADWLRGFGNLLIIDHGQNYLTIYGNNEALFKEVGDRVKAGDVITAVGNSGGNPDSGLYFELRYKGEPVDPMKWVNLK